MIAMLKHHRPSPAMLVAVVALIAAVGGGVALASSSGSREIHGCFQRTSGELRLGAHCPPGFSAISWNRLGPAGRNGHIGHIGRTGPGGPPGVKGETGAQGAACDPSNPACKGPKGDQGAACDPSNPACMGPKGDQGAACDPSNPACVGPKGDQGAACDPSNPACKGPKGDTGPTGPSDVYIARGGTNNTLTLTVPAGNYAISAKAGLFNRDTDPQDADCTLSTGDRSSVRIGQFNSTGPDEDNVQTVALVDTATFNSTTTITLACHGFNIFSRQEVISAIKVGAVH